MTSALEPVRERQAKAEIGHTEVTRPVAAYLVAVLLAIIAIVPAIQIASGRPLGVEAARQVEPSTAEAWREGGLFAANRALLAKMHRFEDTLERESWLSEALLPPAQRVLLLLGAGNEQVYPGRAGWLFYRPDIDHVTGPGFLWPAVLERRARSGDAWTPAPQPDPVVAILELAAQLQRRGIALVVLPAPVKPALHPERFSPRAPAARVHRGAARLENPSFPVFRERLSAAGIRVVDVAPALIEAREARRLDPLYLARDTHWTPATVEVVARQLAAAVSPLLPPQPSAGYRRVGVEVTGTGDLTAMLTLPRDLRLYPPQPVRVQRVLETDRRAWEPRADADVLLLGDSFTNVYSQPDLGWGEGAGLAEQLSFELQRPVDRIAINAGGAWSARERLAAELRRGNDRLAGKRVVVYEFAARELTSGDWRRIELP
jgi:alginate O-acetyltransferase complex protein AlgJ